MVKKSKLLPKLESKLHHLFTGGIIAYITAFIFPAILTQQVFPEWFLLLFSIIAIAFPSLRIRHHRRHNSRASHSRITCFSGGYGIVFPILYLYKENILDFIFNLI